jgi:cation transporter-like permease
VKQKYKEYLKLNKNILFGYVASVVISAIAAQLLSEQENYLNTTFTLLVDYSVYLSTFGGLYYMDNRKKYKLESGETDWHVLKKDLIKLISSLGIGEIIYIIARWVLQYYLLTEVYEPYLASIIAQSISFVIFLIVVNLGVKLTGLYKDGT